MRALLALIALTEALILKDPVAEPHFDLHFSTGRIATAEAYAKLRGPRDEGTAGMSSEDIHAQIKGNGFKYRLIHDGRDKYLCAVPNITEVHRQAQRNSDRLLSNTERTAAHAQEKDAAQAAATRGLALLSKLTGVCLYSTTGWWTYQVCIGQWIQQYHARKPQPGEVIHPPPVDQDVARYTLGRAPPAEATGTAVPPQPQVDGTAKFLSVVYEGGTYCPLIRGQRKTEVRFQCCHADSEHIASIKEVASCEYRIIVHTSRLCHDVAFQEQEALPNEQIVCTLISDDPMPVPVPKKKTHEHIKLENTEDFSKFFAEVKEGASAGEAAAETPRVEAESDAVEAPAPQPEADLTPEAEAAAPQGQVGNEAPPEAEPAAPFALHEEL